MSNPPISPALTEAKKLVNTQAKDPGLWFIAHYASEAYLQAALRQLHAVIEDEPTLLPPQPE